MSTIGLTAEQQLKYDLVEVIGDEKLRKQLGSNKCPHIYWGTATTGRPHIGYFVPMSKIADYLKADCKVTILLADLHAYLDNMKSSWELLDKRVSYYENVIKTLLRCVNVPIEKLYFIRGTEYQLSKQYTLDVIRLATNVSQRDAFKAGAEVVKQVDNPMLSGLLYPLLQALDEHHLKVDGQFGGVDQRKIFILAEEQLPKLAIAKRFHLMNPMVPGLNGTKMSSSEENSKIDVLDSIDVVNRKMQSALCKSSEIIDNGVLSFAEHVVLPLLHGEAFVLQTNRIGETMSFVEFIDLKNAFAAGLIDGDELKRGVGEFLNRLLDPIRLEFETDDMRQLVRDAYPSEIGSHVDTPLCNSLTLNELTDREIDDLFKPIIDASKTFGNGQRIAQKLSAKVPIRVLWTIVPTDHVHIGHLSMLIKLSQLIKAGFHIVIAIEDLIGYMDNMICPWDVRIQRSKYYQRMLTLLLMEMKVCIDNVTFHIASDYQLERDYVLDLYKLASNVTRDSAHNACVDMCKQLEHPMLSTLLCPLLLTLDEQHLNVDIHIGSDDMNKCFTFAQETLSKIGYESRLYVCMTIVDSLIEPLDTAKMLKNKLKKIFCEPGNVDNNISLMFAKQIIFPIIDNIPSLAPFIIHRSDENGGDVQFDDYKSLQQMFAKSTLHPGDLKSAIEHFFDRFFEPIRQCFSINDDDKALLTASFPPPKKGAKQKNTPA